MMVAGIGILCWLMIRSRGRNRTRSAQAVEIGKLGHNANATVSTQTFSGTQSLGAPREVLKWQVELHDLGRELKAELDTKMLAVQNLTRQYDQAANRLAEMIRLAEQAQVPAPAIQKIARILSAEGWSVTRIAATLELPPATIAELTAPESAVVS